jgi:hypothetical protein
LDPGRILIVVEKMLASWILMTRQQIVIPVYPRSIYNCTLL